MAYKHDVFVSYAGEDKVFARQLVAWLEQADELDVWFAEEDMSAGADIQQRIVEDVRQTRHHIFVISEDWLRKDWTCWERDLVLADLSPDQNVVPVQRVPRDVGKLGPKLNRIKGIDWFEDEDEPHARFWEVLCGLGYFELGKEASWAENGRQALGMSSSNVIAVQPDEADHRAAQQAGRRSSPAALTCDRDPQWGDLSRLSTDGRHEAILVVGPQGEGHKFFLERIVSCLPRDPNRRICEIWWGVRPPMARGPAFDAIAKAIDCSPDRLESTLHSILSKQNLVLVHQPPFEDAHCDVLVRYYTEWLQELVGAIDKPDAPVEGELMLVQALRWPEVSSVKRGLFQVAKLVGATPKRLRTQCAKFEAAEKLIQELETTRGPLPIRFLQELSQITEDDVIRWSKTLPDIVEEDRESLVEHALGGETSVDILNRIAERLDPQRDSQTREIRP